MGVLKLSTNDLVRIAAAGGGFRISGRSYSVPDLVRIAAASSSQGARIIIEDSRNIVANDLVRIAAASRGGVIFE